MKRKKDSKSYVAIDPGKGGGIAYYDGKKGIGIRCPKTIYDMSTIVSVIFDFYNCAPDDIYLLIEHVHAFPTDGRSSAFTFGRNLGQWEGIIACHEIKINTVEPRVWQKFYKIPKIKDKYKRKQWLKEKAIKLFEDTKVTLANCDALLLLNYAKETNNG